MRFRITLHSGSTAPADALDLLWQRLEGYRGDVRFARVDAQIRATWEEDAPISMERDEREEVGRSVVLGIVCDVCALPPEIKSDWFAVGTLG